MTPGACTSPPADRGAGAAAQILHGSARAGEPARPITDRLGRAGPRRRVREDPRSLELCADAGSRGWPRVARAAAADARARGETSAARAHRAGDAAGVAGLALEQLPTAHVASADPSTAAVALVRLRWGTPGRRRPEQRRRDGFGGWRVAIGGRDGDAGPGAFRRARGLRGALTELARAGTTASDAAGAKRAVGSAAASAAARRAGSPWRFSTPAGQSHLWTEALFHAVRCSRVRTRR